MRKKAEKINPLVEVIENSTPVQWQEKIRALLKEERFSVSELALCFHQAVLKAETEQQYDPLIDLIKMLQDNHQAFVRFVHPSTIEILEQYRPTDSYKTIRHAIATYQAQIPRADASLTGAPYSPPCYHKTKLSDLAVYKETAIKQRDNFVTKDVYTDNQLMATVFHLDGKVLSLSPRQPDATNRIIGQGGNGAVYECEWECVLPLSGNTEYVYVRQGENNSVIKSSNNVIEDSEQRFTELLYQGSRVVKFGTHYNPSIAISMEKARGENLASMIINKDNGFSTIPLAERLRLAIKMIAIVRNLHAKGIIHADLKPEQFVVEVKDNKIIHVSLIDFGFSKQADSSTGYALGPLAGTTGFVAPEVENKLYCANQRAYDSKSDSYALGIALAEVLLARRSSIETLQVYSKSRNHSDVPGQAQFNRIKDLLAQSPKKRMTLETAQQQLEEAIAELDPVSFLIQQLKQQGWLPDDNSKGLTTDTDERPSSKQQALYRLALLVRSSQQPSLGQLIAQLHQCILASEEKQKDQHQKNKIAKWAGTQSKVSQSLQSLIKQLNLQFRFQFPSNPTKAEPLDINPLGNLDNDQMAALSELLKQPNQMWHKNTPERPQDYYVSVGERTIAIRLQHSIIKEGADEQVRFYILPAKSHTEPKKGSTASVKAVNSYFSFQSERLVLHQDASLVWKSQKIKLAAPNSKRTYAGRQQFFAHVKRERDTTNQFDDATSEITPLDQVRSEQYSGQVTRVFKAGFFMQDKQGQNLAEKCQQMHSTGACFDLSTGLHLFAQMLTLANNQIKNNTINYDIGWHNFIINDQNELFAIDFGACAGPNQGLPLHLLATELAYCIDAGYKRFVTRLEEGVPFDTVEVSMNLTEGFQLMQHQLTKAFLKVLNPTKSLHDLDSFERFKECFISEPLREHAAIKALYDMLQSMRQLPTVHRPIKPMEMSQIIGQVSQIQSDINQTNVNNQQPTLG